MIQNFLECANRFLVNTNFCVRVKLFKLDCEVFDVIS